VRDDCITVLLGLEELAVLEHDELEDRIEVVVRYRRQGEQCPRCGLWTEKVHSTSRQRNGDKGIHLSSLPHPPFYVEPTLSKSAGWAEPFS